MKRKIRWNRIIITLLSLLLTILLIHDLILVIVTPASFTWFGLFTFIVLYSINGCLIDEIISWIGSDE